MWKAPSHPLRTVVLYIERDTLSLARSWVEELATGGEKGRKHALRSRYVCVFVRGENQTPVFQPLRRMKYAKSKYTRESR